MAKEATGRSAFLREVDAKYEVALENATCLLGQCWRMPETVAIKAADGELVKCSTMVERVIEKMTRKLGIALKNRQLAVGVCTVNYLMGLARFGARAWKDPNCSLSVDEEIVESARNETIDELRKEYENRTGEVKITCIDGVVIVHEGVAHQLKVVSSASGTPQLPISQRQLSLITDLVYFGKTSFKGSELAAIFVASTFATFEKIIELREELSREIANDWKSALSIDSIGQLNPVGLTILCTREDFVVQENTVEVSASLEKWAEGSARRQGVKASLLDLLCKNSAQTGTRDYTKFIYYHGHKFDGQLWTVSELHRESSKRFSYTNAVVNAEGDRIVSSRPGPIGILSTKSGFSESYHLPHDALGYGYPFIFHKFPYVCLVFNTFDSRSKRYRVELWPWKEDNAFEPICTSFQWVHVGDMVQVREDLFYLTGKKLCYANGALSGVEGRYDNTDEKNEIGLFRMHVTRVDGVLRGEVEMVEPYTPEQYRDEHNTEFFCIGEILYRQQRHFDFNKYISSPAVLSRLEQNTFVLANDFQPVTGAWLQTWVLGRQTFAIASLYDETNSACPCGFFELVDENVWRDRTLETGFFNVYPKWKPVNDSFWRKFGLESK
ncbi:hypothetical protein BIW11_11278 [Tropilaelaps mercedesae]|uniref:Uncharacterized protein n=1 Tax=Tropilaelaps mercedesae TaxID=418985 RepID=A0A1V9XC52_9ACAR|nr:hypothetical protein BIW11_11278 [Tropilaelaps mercedesae]